MAMHGFGKLSYTAIGAAAAIAAALGGAVTQAAQAVSDVFVTPTSVPVIPISQRNNLQWVPGNNGLPPQVQGVHFEANEPVNLFVLSAPEVPTSQYQFWMRVEADGLGQFMQGMGLGMPINTPATFYVSARGKRDFVAPVGPISLPKAAATQMPAPLATAAVSVQFQPTLVPTLIAALQPTATPKPLNKDPLGECYVEYHNNRDLDGAPVVARNEPVPNTNWGAGAPAGVNADNFSVSYSGRFFFPQTENYEFVIVADDGVRLWVDNVLVRNEWRIGSRREIRANVPLTRGEHPVRLEYFDSTGGAQVSLRWSVNYPDWEARYYNSVDWTGAVVLKRNDGDEDGRLRVNWDGSPGPGVNPDNFSVSWERRMFFDVGGEYDFTLELDDGAKIYIDGVEVFNRPNAVDTHHFKRRLARGAHIMQVMFVEYSGGAKLKLDWALVPPTPAP